MSNSLRLFFAVEIPEEIKIDIETFNRSIDRQKWRPVRKEQLHITLAFLGEVPEDQLPRVIEAGKKIAAKTASFSVELADTGIFPESDEPRVLLINVASDTLAKMMNELKSELGPLADQKKVKPHLTVARRKGERARKEIRKVRGTWQAKEFLLFKSTLSENGPDYQVIEKFQLL